MKMIKTAPCKDCPRRKVGCHSKCSEYQAYRAYLDSLLERKFWENEANGYAIELKFKLAYYPQIGKQSPMAKQRRR